jgi:FMN hydrolase / 5-amino-6-(5-phospho-D-ribitylamino)uracil phosphatase
MPIDTLRALTLDLDDTLWPVGPTLVAAENALHAWLAQHAPATSARFPLEAMRQHRARIGQQHPHLAHDMSALRVLSLRETLAESGDDPALAEPAFDTFFAARQRVTLFDDVALALDRLSARWPLVALTNGNAELEATGLSRWFSGYISARGCGVAKPDPRIFHAACAHLGCEPGQVLHIGDDHALDVLGARAAGLHTAWVCREAAEAVEAVEADAPPIAAGGMHWRVRDLAELVAVLGV